jgi:uncharacterized protein YecE (DUF72 family)
MNVWLGCAIWAYKDWVGEFFPSGSRPSDFLSLYSRRFTAVEGNTTFYSVPAAETVKQWASATPEGFKFCPKLPKSITHQGLLSPRIAETYAFVERMQGLGTRLGVLFAQLPSSYGPQNFTDLTAFLQAFPYDRAALALEVRHLDWFNPEMSGRLNELLETLGVGRVLLDTRPIYDCADDPQIASERRKPRVPLQPVATAPFSLIRYISHPDWQQNQRFLQTWINQIEQWQPRNQQVYFFVHCPIERHSPAIARQFQHLLEQRVPVPPLPWDQLEATTQLSLF